MNSSEKQRGFGILAIKIWSSCLDTALKELLTIGNVHLLVSQLIFWMNVNVFLCLKDYMSSIINTECDFENLHNFVVQDVCL